MSESPPTFVPPEPPPLVPEAQGAPLPPAPLAPQPPVAPPARLVPPPSGLPPIGSVPIPPAALAYPPDAVAPHKKERKGLIIAVVVAVAVLLLGGIIAGILALATVIAGAIEDTPSSVVVDVPLATGGAGSPVAEDPLECPDSCFTSGVVGDTISSKDEFAAMGVTTNVQAWGAYADTTARAEYGVIEDIWNEQGASPEECFVTFFDGPVAVALGDKPEGFSDRIFYTGVESDEEAYSQLAHSVRLFEDSELAVAHMADLSTLVSRCSYYESGRGNERYSADVTAFPELELPPSVAAVGWVESSPSYRYYGLDLQRGNVVVRNTLGTFDGQVSEKQFRTYLEHLAQQLAELPVE